MKPMRSLALPLAALLLAGDPMPLPAQNAAANSDTLIQLVNNPISDVLATYEQLTGKQVIKEGSLPETTIHINVTEPVTREEAIELLESALLLNGFTMMPGPGNSVKVVSIAGGKNPRSQGIKVFTAQEALPAGEQLVSYIMKLNFLSAQEAAPIFNQHFAPTPPFGSVVAVPSANMLLITESAAVVRQMIRMRELIDVPPVEVSAHFVPMLRANADRVVETITKVLGEGPGRPSGSGAGEGGGAPATGGRRLLFNFGQGNPVEFAADARTNRVIVVCNAAAFPYFEAFVRSFDVPSDQAPSEEFKLRYVSVGDVLPAIASMLKEGRKEGQGGDDSQPDANHPFPENTTVMTATPVNPGTTTGGGGATNVLGSVQENANKVLPLTVSVGSSRLIADQRNNTIIAVAPPESLDRIRSVIDQLDKPALQVYLSIVIMELDVSKGLDYGVDFYRQGSHTTIASNQRIGGPSIQQLLNPATAAHFLANSQNTPGMALFGTFGTTADILVTALEGTGRTKVLGRPTVYTSNNKKAVISVGEQIPVPQSTISTVNPNQNNSTALTSTIDYKDVLLQLEVVPLINNNNEVTLEIAQKNDTLGQTYLIAGSEAQSVRTQQIKTSVTVPNKHTVVIGGLINDREEKTHRKVPILGDIPILGLAFKGVSTKKERKELILLIQPQIVSDDGTLFKTDALEKHRTRVIRDSEAFINPPLPEEGEIPPEAQLVPFEPEKPTRGKSSNRRRKP